MTSTALSPPAGPTPDQDDFALYYDSALTDPTPYDGTGDYLRMARPRMDRTFALIEKEIAGAHIVDIGASPFYLLDRALKAGARQASGIYFAHDDHPLKARAQIFSRYGTIDISHRNIEEQTLPYDDDSVDVLSACEILEHCEYFPLLLANEIRRVLRPGGLLCLTVPNVASIANIVKLAMNRNIFMKYRSDASGRHKHEYTKAQLDAFVAFLGMAPVARGVLPFVTSDKAWPRLSYRVVAATPGLRRHSPKLFQLARQPDPKPTGVLTTPPAALYDDVASVED